MNTSLVLFLSTVKQGAMHLVASVCLSIHLTVWVSDLCLCVYYQEAYADNLADAVDLLLIFCECEVNLTFNLF